MGKKYYLGLIVLILLLGVVFMARILFRKQNLQGTGSIPTNLITTTVTPEISRENSGKTEIIDYQQTYIPMVSQSGYCWTGSIASTNKNAWRCMTGSSIYDPCYETDSGKVVCDVDLNKPGSGFELKLTQSLPDDKYRNSGDEYQTAVPWMVELENGLDCNIMTGTAGRVENISFNWTCSDGSVLLNSMDTYNKNSATPWVVTVAYPKKDMTKILKTEKVAVIKAWE